MPAPRLLVLSGSLRTGSFNSALAALAARELSLAGADVSLISLADYRLPIYDADLEARSGPPAEAVKLKQQFSAHQGIFLACPEYNASITPLLKNALDWVSRVREGKEPPLAAFKNRVFALGAASDGALGGYRGLIAMRHMLELGTGATVLPEMVSVSQASTAFDDGGGLKDPRAARMLKSVVTRLIETAGALP